MAKAINPFIVTGKIAPEYFCDRVNESARLVKSITNGNNLVIISPRRMGKTGLIQFCYDKPEISKEYYTFFIDILHTSSLNILLTRFSNTCPMQTNPVLWQSTSFNKLPNIRKRISRLSCELTYNGRITAILSLPVANDT